MSDTPATAEAIEKIVTQTVQNTSLQVCIIIADMLRYEHPEAAARVERLATKYKSRVIDKEPES
jgi:hypothetical protein